MLRLRSNQCIEYDPLARTTQHLSIAWARRTQDFPALAEAVSDNTRLWSTLGADVADPGNGLPQKLRAQLYYLFGFTAQHSRLVPDGSAGAEVLIDINTAGMRGLRGANEVAA